MISPAGRDAIDEHSNWKGATSPIRPSANNSWVVHVRRNLQYPIGVDVGSRLSGGVLYMRTYTCSCAGPNRAPIGN